MSGGLFVTFDGPGGAGKSTTVRTVAEMLRQQGYPVCATTEPSQDQLGELARHGTDTYGGLALACLVAADRYHHLETTIRPALAAGEIVLCDRYVASSLVLQHMDGVAMEFIARLNAAAPLPDLAVLITANPEITAERITARGAHSRFENGLETSRTEARLYRSAAEWLTERGRPPLTVDTTCAPNTEIAALIATRIGDTQAARDAGRAAS